MIEPNRKNKMISLRLSEQEYEDLKSRSASRGVRSLSELAREAMHLLLTQDAAAEPPLEKRVSALEGELSRLTRMVEEELMASRKAG